jgi:hypothetical protein
MSVLVEVLQELWNMFVGDRRLTLWLLLLVALVAAIPRFLTARPEVLGGALVLGAMAVLADSVAHAARRARR